MSFSEEDYEIFIIDALNSPVAANFQESALNMRGKFQLILF